MNEQEKAQKLSDAIDAILEGREPNLDDPELEELLGIARLRLRAGKALADVGLTYQELLRRVLQARMASRHMKPSKETEEPPPETGGITTVGDPGDYLDPLDPGYGKLVNFLDFWPRVGQVEHPGSDLPGTVRGAAAKKAGQALVIPLWQASEQHKATKADALAPVVDRVVRKRKQASPMDDPELEELMQVATLRRYVGQALAAAGTPYKRRLWSILRLRLAAALRRQASEPGPRIAAAMGHGPWKYGAAAAAVLAFTLFALGPWAATGFADHPISQVFQFVSEHVGVAGVDGPPPTQVPVHPANETVSPEQAGELLGLPVRQPTYLPEGFKLTSSVYYAEGSTSPEQGTYQLVYTQGGVEPRSVPLTDPIILIYQERSTSDALAQQTDHLDTVLIGDAVSATFAQGMWASSPDGTLQWADGNAQTLVFDRDGVRTAVVWKMAQDEKEELIKIAESMLAQ